MNTLRKEFNKRVKSLKLDDQTKEELYNTFCECYGEGFKCYYCRRKMDLSWQSEFSFSIDHYVARSKGGKDTVENLRFCCRDCNFLKGDMDPEKYLNNMEQLIARKKKTEYWKARRASKKDEQTREAYKDIFSHLDASKTK